MRLFAAIQPSDDFRNALSALQDRLRDAGVTGRFQEPSNLHLTLAFIGEWPDNISELLPAVQKPFPITLSHLGVFPEARVLWAGVEPSEELDDLAKRVKHNLTEAGIPFDPKSFNPHITLIRKPVVPQDIDLSGIAVPPASMEVHEVCLYRSDHKKDGMVYTVIGNS